MEAKPFPLFVKLAGRDVLVVGGGAMAALRVRQLADSGARITVVAPEVRDEVAALAHVVHRRPFVAGDVRGAWLVIAAATPEVNADVARVAEARHVLVNAVDDPAHASAYTAGVVRRGDATVAISTGGRAPALAGLLREAIESFLPAELGTWVDEAEALRPAWKRAGVPLGERRARLLEVLNERYGSSTAAETPPPTPTGGGFVSLVGAGPGDPGLLTRRAAERLAEADLVLYDALVSGSMLTLAPRAHCFFVGKRAGRPSVKQETIQRMLIDAARLGKRVVRLKAGDPFVLGRGGEEAAALEAAGVPYEVVPGVSSALAAPALAGIPVTHRGLATGFAVVSGHAEEAWRPALDSLSPGSLTVVVLMGLASRAAIAGRLQERGWAPTTPAAICLAAGTPHAFTWTGSLAQLGAVSSEDHAGAPGVLVIGAVAALGRATLPLPLPEATPATA